MRNGPELKDLITELETPFTSPAILGTDGIAYSLKDRISQVEDIVFTRKNYAAKMASKYENPGNLAAATLRFDKDTAISALRTKLRLSLTPQSELERAKTAADRMEVYEANMLLRSDSSGNIRENMHAYQTYGFFYPCWAAFDEYEESDEREGETTEETTARHKRERAMFMPYRLVELNPLSVYWTEPDHTRTPSMAVAKYKLPIVDLLEKYGKSYKVSRDNPDAMLKVCNEHFGYLRGDQPGDPWTTRDVFRKSAEVMLVDDGDTICHYADVAGGNQDERYKGLGEGEYPNPWGQCSLLLAEGVFNPGQPIAYRREPLLHSTIAIEDQRAMAKSTLLSDALSTPRIVFTLPKEVATQYDNDNPPPDVAFSKNDIPGTFVAPYVLGDPKLLFDKPNPSEEQLLAILDAEAQRTSPAGLLFQQEGTLSEIPATVVLKQADEFQRRVEGAQRSETNFWNRWLDMCENADRSTLNSHRKPYEGKREGDWPRIVITVGKEAVKGKAIGGGEEVTITPQDLDGQYTRTIEPVDTRLSTQIARSQEASRRYQSGTLLYPDYLEECGIENVSDFTEKKVAEILSQLETPRIVDEYRERAAMFTSVLTGEPVESIMQKSAVTPEFANQLGGGEMGGGGLMMRPPAANPVGASAASEAIVG